MYFTSSFTFISTVLHIWFMGMLHGLLLRNQIVYESIKFHIGRLITGFSHVRTLQESWLYACSLTCRARALSVEGLRGSNQHSGPSNKCLTECNKCTWQSSEHKGCFGELTICMLELAGTVNCTALEVSKANQLSYEPVNVCKCVWWQMRIPGLFWGV